MKTQQTAWMQVLWVKTKQSVQDVAEEPLESTSHLDCSELIKTVVLNVTLIGLKFGRCPLLVPTCTLVTSQAQVVRWSPKDDQTWRHVEIGDRDDWPHWPPFYNSLTHTPYFVCLFHCHPCLKKHFKKHSSPILDIIYLTNDSAFNLFFLQQNSVRSFRIFPSFCFAEKLSICIFSIIIGRFTAIFVLVFPLNDKFWGMNVFHRTPRKSAKLLDNAFQWKNYVTWMM